MIWRYLLAFSLSMLVLVLWPVVFPPPPRAPAPPPTPAGQELEGGRPGGAEALPEAAGRPPPEAAELSGEAPARPQFDAIALEVDVPDRLRAELRSAGAVLSRLWLPAFHETVESPAPYELLEEPQAGHGTFAVEILEQPIPAGENWQVERVAARPGGLPPGVRAQSRTDGGLLVTKTIVAGVEDGWSAAGEGEAGSAEPAHHFILRLEIENTGSTLQKVRYRLEGPQGIDSESIQAPGTDVYLAFGARATRRIEVAVEDSKLTHDAWERGDIAWVGVSNNYFATVLVPGVPGEPPATFVAKAWAAAYPDPGAMASLAEEAGKALEELSAPERQELAGKVHKNLRVGFQSAEETLAPGATLLHEYTLIAVPRQRRVLERYDALNLSEVNDYGTFSGLVKMFIYLLSALRSLAFGSWGLGIIVLTVLVKLCLHPINKRSQRALVRSQKKMQKVKPEMDALKERFKDNPMKRNQEMQKLFKAHDINPAQQLGGCLVLFLQLPIWFALYNTLRYAFGLRQASFLYITDLTRPDRLVDMGFSLPFLGSHFNLLPVVYVILTVVNQRLQPKPEDPQMRAQYQMMSIMMVFFGVIFYQFPSGFMLYLMTSTALGIVESKIIKAELAREEATAPENAGGTPVPAAPYRARAKGSPKGKKANKKKR